MAADGGRRIRMFCSLDNKEILDSSVSVLHGVYVCVSLGLGRCLYLLKNAIEKNRHEQKRRIVRFYKPYLESLFGSSHKNVYIEISERTDRS